MPDNSALLETHIIEAWMNKSSVEIFRMGWCSQISDVLPRLEIVMWTQVLLNWLDDSWSRYRIHFWMAAFGDYPRGALGELGRTVILRPIKSGVQVCGIIQWPWYFQCNNSLLPTLKIAGCWKSHYNHPSLQWKSLTGWKNNSCIEMRLNHPANVFKEAVSWFELPK